MNDSEMIKPIAPLEPVYDAVEHRDFRALLQYASVAYAEDAAFITKHMVTDEEAEGGEEGKTDYTGAGTTDNGKRGRANKRAVYRHISYREYRDDVEALGTGLMAEDSVFGNVRAGTHIAVVGINSYPWFLSYMTVMNGLGVCVPLDKNLPYEELETSLERSHSEILIFDRDHRELADRVFSAGKVRLLCMDENVSSPDGGVYPNIWDVMATGRQKLSCGDASFLELPIDPDEVSLLIFTSGTTSRAKAVMLTQRNVMNNVYVLQQVENIMYGDVNMAFLPYHHTFGSSGQLLMLACGVTTVFCDGLKYVQKNMVEYGVSVFVGVPLLIEAIYKKIMREVEKQGKMDTFRKGQKIAGALNKAHLARLGIGKHKVDLRRVLFKEIHEKLGGNLRFVVSGASALDPEVAKGYESLGITVTQGYGMTECSPVIAAENHYNRKPGTIGKPMPGTTVIIDDPNEEGIGEMLVKGDSVMKGYYEDEEETAKALAGGWLHTGDLAWVDEDGYITIAGRSKNVIVMASGKNIYPEELETLIGNLPYVKENIVIGQKRREDGDDKDLVLAAKIVYDPVYMKEEFGAETEEAIEAAVRKDIDAINETLPAYKHVYRLILQETEMNKTTTGKVKRFEEGA